MACMKINRFGLNMRLAAIILTFTAICLACPAMGQDITLQDKTSLFLRGDSGACLTDDGKKVLLASIAKDRQAIAYTVIGSDGKDKRQVYKFNLGELNRCEYHNVLAGRRGFCSADGGAFLAHGDLDKDKHIEMLGNPVVVNLSNGKASPVCIPDQLADSALTFSGFLNLYGAFGRDDAVYCVISDAAKKDSLESTVSNKIVRHDLKSGREETIAELGYVATRLICISPDRTKLAGIVVDPEKYLDKKPSVKVWAYQISTNRLEYSQSFAVWDETMPFIAWSRENSTVYVASDAFGAGGLFACDFFIQPTRKDLEECDVWAAQLGDSNYKVRGEAFSKLQAAGPKASETIGRAAKSDDAEVAARARMLQAQIGVCVIRLSEKNCESVFEVAPGWLCVKFADSPTMKLVEVATRKAWPALEKEKFTLVDLVGDVGLFRDVSQNLWTARIAFSSTPSRPAIETCQTNPSGSE